MQIDRWTWLCVVAGALALAGCTASNSTESAARSEGAATQHAGPPTQSRESTATASNTEGPETVTARKVVQDDGTPSGTAGDSTGQTKEDYLRNLDDQLKQIDQELDTLQKNAAALSAEAKSDWQQTWTDLQQQRQQLRERVQQIQSDSTGAWKDLRQGTDAAWKDMQQAVDKARQRFQNEGHSGSPPQNGGGGASP